MIDATKLTPPLNSVHYFFSPISETPPMDWVTPGSCSSVEAADQKLRTGVETSFPRSPREPYERPSRVERHEQRSGWPMSSEWAEIEAGPVARSSNESTSWESTTHALMNRLKPRSCCRAKGKNMLWENEKVFKERKTNKTKQTNYQLRTHFIKTLVFAAIKRDY